MSNYSGHSSVPLSCSMTFANRPHDCDILIDPCPTNTQESRILGLLVLIPCYYLVSTILLLRPEFNDVPNRNFHERFSNSVPQSF